MIELQTTPVNSSWANRVLDAWKIADIGSDLLSKAKAKGYTVQLLPAVDPDNRVRSVQVVIKDDNSGAEIIVGTAYINELDLQYSRESPPVNFRLSLNAVFENTRNMLMLL
jgi:hypothetical protein